MRRAIARIALFTLGISLLAPFAGDAAVDDTIDGTLMVDYSKPPTFKVGSWVRYHGTANSKLGFKRDYTLTLLIAGEEEVWGDKCFWLETWTEHKGRELSTSASLISYTAFGDTMALKRGTWFIRKMVTGPSGKPGEPEFSLWTRDKEEVRRGKGELQKLDVGMIRGTTYDTLGVDTASVPRGNYRGRVVREQSHITLESMKGDSTYRDMRVETRTRKMADEIPITHLVREDVLDSQKRRGWVTGRSSEVKETLLEEGIMRTMVVEYGQGNLKPIVIPARLQSTIAERAAKAKKPPTSGTAKKAG
jgi:hypothetical protein